jgi:hypothetical protein
MHPLFLFAQESKPIVDAWEDYDSTFHKTNISPPQSIFLDMSNFLISFYKKDISTESVSRCPFAISCSSFCKEALRKHGVLGLVLFIDRYFYRENIDSFSHYKLIQTNYGVLKLDDEYFLF